MAWPKKHTRKLHVADREYLWHLSGNSIYRENRVTVGVMIGKHFLFIDPYDHDFQITPSSVRNALEWALNEGWSPNEGPTRSMSFSNDTFHWLPDDVKFVCDLDEPPSDIETDKTE